jgi:hypothetical protein
MDKPKSIVINNELFEVVDERDKDELAVYILGPRLGLGPFEAEELRDFLDKYLKYYYEEVLK